MEVSNNLKKQIIVEISVLLLMTGVILYAYFSLNENFSTKVMTEDGLVLVLDDTKFKPLKPLSDGMGLENDFVRYTITNNNNVIKDVKLVIIPVVDDIEVLNDVRVGINDIMVNDLTEFEKISNGYIVDEFKISPGFTRNYLFKYWLKQDTNNNESKVVDFEYKIFIEDV